MRRSESFRKPLLIGGKSFLFLSRESLKTWNLGLMFGRGNRFRAKFPENSLAAFEGAAKAGAHAIETGGALSPRPPI